MPIDQLAMPKSGDTIAIMQTSLGDMKLRLFPEVAPKAVENFTEHAEAGYYDGLIFHRVIKDFMIQGGDPTGTGMGGKSIWGGSFEDEFDLTARNYCGALSMANAGPNTNGSQFFIVHASSVPDSMLSQMEELRDQGFPEEVEKNYRELGGTPWLDFKHTVFGQLYEGREVLDAIANEPVGFQDKPEQDITIQKIQITTCE